MIKKIFILESIKDNQCIDFLIGSIHQIEDKNYKLTFCMGPLNRAFLFKSDTFKRFLSNDNFIFIPSYKIKQKKNLISYVAIKFIYYIIFFLTNIFNGSNSKIKIMERIWEKFSSKLKYKNIQDSFDDILIPWRKPNANIHSFIKGLNSKAKNKLLLIPHAPMYDECGFRDENNNSIFEGIKRIYPHKNYDLNDTHQDKKVFVIEPNYKYLEENNFITKTKLNKIKLLYLSQKLSRNFVLSKRKFTYQLLSKTETHIQEILTALEECSIDNFDFKFRIPLHMCRGSISHQDFKDYPIKLITDGLLIDDIISADIIFSDYTSAMIYALKCRPTRIINSDKLNYFFSKDLNIEKLLSKYKNAIINSVSKENLIALIYEI